MLDPKLENDAVKEIIKALAIFGAPPDSWTEDSIRSQISIITTRAYQEGQRDAFLAMGKFMQK